VGCVLQKRVASGRSPPYACVFVLTQLTDAKSLKLLSVLPCVGASLATDTEVLTNVSNHESETRKTEGCGQQ